MNQQNKVQAQKDTELSHQLDVLVDQKTQFEWDLLDCQDELNKSVKD